MAKIITDVEELNIAGKKYWKISGATRIIDEIDIAYCAGIIDGEGSIIIGKGKQRIWARIFL